MGLFNLDTEQVSAVTERREIVNGLKPVGMYLVVMEAVTFFASEGKTPCLSFQLRIRGMYNKDGETLATKKDGSKVYANACLFYKAFISEKSLFALENVMFAMGETELVGAELAAKLNSFTTQQQLVKWVNTWLDTETEIQVYVNHDLKAAKPAEKVHFQTPRPKVSN